VEVKINNKIAYLTEEELEFVRFMLGEWEVKEGVFEKPVYLSVTDIAEYLGKTRQGILWLARERGIEVKQFGKGNAQAFLRFEDVVKVWFRGLKSKKRI
jgi:hypothetical protein